MSINPTPTIGAPPTLTPGDPKALPLPPVVCTPPILLVVPFAPVVVDPSAPVVDVPPNPDDDPKPLPEPELVPPMVEPDEPLLLKGELEDPEPNDEPLLPNGDPEELGDEPLLLYIDPEDPGDEPLLPKPEPEDPDPPKGEDDPPMPVALAPFVAPVGVMPPVWPTVCPNKPTGGTLASP